MEPDRLTAAQKRKVMAIMAAVVIVLAGLLALLFAAIERKDAGKAGKPAVDGAQAYAYTYAEASNGMKLHVLMSQPSNLTLEVINGNVTRSGKTGVNGGFFYAEGLISLAVVNGQAVNGPNESYGSGYENMKYKRGTLVWDAASDSLSVQVAGSASELQVTDAGRFWAQGGISMSLGDEEGWRTQAAAENAPFPDDLRLRSGAVYDDRGQVYLVVSENEGTLEQFRSAAAETVGQGRLLDGIFLDGDGSSQLLSKEAALAGDNRSVVQMIRIMK